MFEDIPFERNLHFHFMFIECFCHVHYTTVLVVSMPAAAVYRRIWKHYC